MALGHKLEFVKGNLEKVYGTSLCTAGLCGLPCDGCEGHVGHAYFRDMVFAGWGINRLSVLW